MNNPYSTPSSKLFESKHRVIYQVPNQILSKQQFIILALILANLAQLFIGLADSAKINRLNDELMELRMNPQ